MRRCVSGPALVAALGLVGTVVGCGARPGAAARLEAMRGEGTRVVVASLVGKEAVGGGDVAFYNRFASKTQRLVVGAEAVAGADQIAEVVEREGEELHVVEGHPLPLAALPGERARLDRFAIVAAPRDTSAHALIGTHTLYTEKVAARLTQPARALPELDLRASAGRTLRSFAGRDIVEADLEHKVRELSGDIPVTIDGRVLQLGDRRATQGRADARAWLRREYEALGYTVTDEAYTSGFNQGTNLVATRRADRPPQGRPTGIVVLSSHLDSVGNAGADDNGGGTITNLAVAKALADVSTQHELRIVAFDQEEIGLVGSAAYVRQLSDRGEIDRVVANLNVEMPGYDADDDGKLHVIDCDENTSPEITAMARAGLAGIEPPLTIEPACTNRSDHANFWRAGRPAVVVSQNFFGGDSNPCYHRACDKADGMHFGYMTRVTTLVARTAEALVR